MAVSDEKQKRMDALAEVHQHHERESRDKEHSNEQKVSYYTNIYTLFSLSLSINHSFYWVILFVDTAVKGSSRKVEHREFRSSSEQTTFRNGNSESLREA